MLDAILDAGIDDYIELIKCLLGKPELIRDVIEAIQTGDYQQLIAIVMKLYTDGKAALNDCLKSDEDNEIELGRPIIIRCPMFCKDIIDFEKKRNAVFMELKINVY